MSRQRVTDEPRAGEPAAPGAGQLHPLPEPTVWPAALGLGLALLALGFATTVIVLAAGVILSALAFWGWARDLVFAAGLAEPGADEPAEAGDG